jgi:hypothetical protein
MLVAGGCGGDGTPEAVTTPPREGGNRKKLDDLVKKKPEAAPVKKQ